MKRISVIILIVSLTVTFSCQSEKALTITNQETAIDKYITSQHSSKELHRNGGANRIVLALGESADSLVIGDKAKLALKGYIFSGGPSTQFCEDTVSAVIGSGYLIPGLDSGLVGAHNGEQCYVVFSAKYGFYDKAVGIVPAMSPLIYDVTVLEIEKSK